MSEMGTVYSGNKIEPITFFERLSKFIAVLRSLGLNTGTSELSDAIRALAIVDVLDRDQFRLALKATLVKKQRDARVFDLAFDRFFVPGEVKEQWRRQEAEAASEQEQLMQSSEAEIMDGVSRSGGEWAGSASEQIKLTEQQLETYTRLPENERKKIRSLLESYRGNPVNDPSNLIAQVVEASLDYWRYHLNKKEDGQGDLRPNYDVSYYGDQEADEVIRSVARDLVREPEESLLEKDMRAIGEQDMPMVIVLLKKMARRLATGLSRRYRGSRKKQAIDIRRTVRGSIQFGGVPLYLRYRSKRVQKPRLVLVCDVSASMARYARLIIQFIYGLADVVKDIETFIFSENLERITPQLGMRMGFAQTMSVVMSESGQWGKTTNLAASLRTFMAGYQQLLTRNTFFIIVSDTKTLEAENAAMLLGEISNRVKDILWLNTLPRGEWQNVRTVELFGRTVRMLESNTLSQLERSMKRL